MATGSWLVGSYESMPAQRWTVTANATTEDVTIQGGSYYLDDSTSSRSLCNAVAVALASHSQITTADCYLTRGRYVGMEADTAFSVTFTDTVARDVLGYNANLTAATDHIAPLFSRYLWVPGKPESPTEAILGVEGRIVKDTRAGLSALGGRVVVTHNDQRVYNDFFWDCITPERFWTTDTLGGEWHEFWDTVVSEGLRFKLYRNTLETAGDDAALTLSAANQLGPYKYRFAAGGRVAFDVQRKQELADANYRVTLPVIVVADYTV